MIRNGIQKLHEFCILNISVPSFIVGGMDSFLSKVFDRIPFYTMQTNFNMGGGAVAANVLNKQSLTRDGPSN